MLELRPICEHCAKDLPPDSLDAMICSFECTFCRRCAERELRGVCPNCGGNFVPRPIRPREDRKGGAFLGRHPAGTVSKHRPVDLQQHTAFAAAMLAIPPERR